MDALEALVLGIIQGLTEWLPVSSSGHLVIAQELLDLPADENLVFDLVVHMGTIAAVIMFLRMELARIVLAVFTPQAKRTAVQAELRTLGFLLLLGTVPVALVGVLLTNAVESAFDIRFVGFALIVNACILFTAERFWSKGAKKRAGVLDTLAIGVFQAISIIPGISRSGSTLSGGMLRGLERETAAVFAFLLSIPALIGASVYGFLTLDHYDTTIDLAAIGFASAFLTGIVSISYLLKAVRAGKLWIFAVYCVIVGAAVVLYTL